MSDREAPAAAWRYTPPQMAMQRRPLVRVAMLTVGWALVALGAIGLALPLLQGVLLILLGLWVLSRESTVARRLHDRLLNRYPGLRTAVERAKARMRRVRQRLRPED
ncbi:MAG TPA: PGPGW domain-containing protein [Thermoanaerobaculales bacterium]|nr:PGPGW domain-containing protein [Thermoanaerobaculales bacterium]